MLVLIHGWALSLEYWDCVLPGLAPARTVLRYDRRGFGLTRGPYDPGKSCGDLLALLDAARVRQCRARWHVAGRARCHPHRDSRAAARGRHWCSMARPGSRMKPSCRWRATGNLRDSAGIFAMREAILDHPLMQPVHPDAAQRALLSTCVDHYEGADLEGTVDARA